MDLASRFDKEMLVLSGPIEAGLARLDMDVQRDLAVANILEPETIKTAIEPYVMGGAHCLVANTKGILQALLAHENLDNRIDEIAVSALKIAKDCKPQHIIVELGNCGLPLDSESKNSLNEFKNQYVTSGRIFAKIDGFDAYLLSGLKNLTQIKCALMGLRQVTDKPIIVNVDVDAQGKINDHDDIYDYAATLVEFGATVAGICVRDDIDCVKMLCKRLRAGCDLPILLDIFVNDKKDSYYYNPDICKDVCVAANVGGAQFLRASGFARPAHTAVLAGTASQIPLKTKIEV